jgi:hypothetical protein
LELQILVRGQSNAIYFMESDGYAAAKALTSEVQRLLGFDGITDTVKTLYANGADQRGAAPGGTAHSGTALLGEWMQPGPDGVWQPASLGAGLLRSAAELDNPAAAATAVLWLHSEFDSRRADLTAGEWTAAVRQDAALLRGALGGDAASVPYHFVSAHPYPDGTPQGHQAIRMGMEALAADPTFHARIAARALDIDASLDDADGDWSTVEYGGGHITPGDALLIAGRAARTIAESWSDYARPGSPVFLAGGDIADAGPRVVSARPIGPDALRLEVAQDAGGGFAPLSAGAASGLGWEVSGTAAPPVAARSAVVRGPSTVDLLFAEPLPEAGGALHYGWGYGRLADGNAPGRGNAVTDEAGLPIWTPAGGVLIGAAPEPDDGLWLR